jgi:hypothetical protein
MNVDDRLKKELGASRRTREVEDRKVTQDRAVSEDDRLEMFRQQLFNDALPDLPELPGYHTIWLTTTNPRDSIHPSRLANGPVLWASTRCSRLSCP